MYMYTKSRKNVLFCFRVQVWRFWSNFHNLCTSWNSNEYSTVRPTYL